MQLAQTYKLLTNSNFLSLQWQQRPNYDSDELRRKPSSLVYPIMYGCDDSFGCPLAQCWDCVQCTLTILKTTQMIVHLFIHTHSANQAARPLYKARQAGQTIFLRRKTRYFSVGSWPRSQTGPALCCWQPDFPECLQSAAALKSSSPTIQRSTSPAVLEIHTAKLQYTLSMLSIKSSVLKRRALLSLCL
jgi:hypothetical protein